MAATATHRLAAIHCMRWTGRPLERALARLGHRRPSRAAAPRTWAARRHLPPPGATPPIKCRCRHPSMHVPGPFLSFDITPDLARLPLQFPFSRTSTRHLEGVPVSLRAGRTPCDARAGGPPGQHVGSAFSITRDHDLRTPMKLAFIRSFFCSVPLASSVDKGGGRWLVGTSARVRRTCRACVHNISLCMAFDATTISSAPPPCPPPPSPPGSLHHVAI